MTNEPAQTPALQTNQAEMMNVVANYLTAQLADGGVRERANERMKRALLHTFLEDDLREIPAEVIAPETARENAVIVGYTALINQVFAVGECANYFRRFPFAGLPISKGDHLRNCCELYFDRIVQFRDRLKALLNSCKKLHPNAPWRTAEFLKLFDKAFTREIRARNHTHHHGRYDDTDIGQLALMSLLQKAPPLEQLNLFTGAHFENVLYRRATRKWRREVTERAEVLSTICELVAELILRECKFIQKYRKEDQDPQLEVSVEAADANSAWMT